MIHRLAVLGCLCLALAGCEEEIDTSPSVQIISPTQDQTLPKGIPVSVTFKVGGNDPETMAPFRLELSQVRRPGYGRVVAYFSTSSIVAEAASEPTPQKPFLIPGPGFGNPADLVTPGRKTIELRLEYNDRTPLPKQRPGIRQVIILD